MFESGKNLNCERASLKVAERLEYCGVENGLGLSARWE